MTNSYIRLRKYQECLLAKRVEKETEKVKIESVKIMFKNVSALSSVP